MDAPRGSCLVLFISVRASREDPEYDALARQMADLIVDQPGFLGMVSVRDPHTLQGMTAATFETEAAALAWKQVVEHRQAQQAGRDRLYRDYRVIVTQVVRSYGR